MSQTQAKPYGSWQSPITADLLVAGTISLVQTALEKETIYWIESRPSEGGRYVVVRRSPDGTITDLTPAPFNARSRVHEYGGGALLVADDTLYYSNFDNQRLYRQPPGDAPVALTPPVDLRYAEAIFDRSRSRLIAVREDHTRPGQEAVNTLVGLPVEGDESGGQILVSGADFYSSPCLNPSGTHLAWLAWDHPNMPWDGTNLWVAEVAADGSLTNLEQVAGGLTESIFQPSWSPDGVLHFVSDRSGWWNLYRWQTGQIEPLCPMEAEFGLPQWVFGLTTYGFSGDGQLICSYEKNGLTGLARLDPHTKQLTPLQTPFTSLGELLVEGNQVVFVGASASISSAVVRLDLATEQFEIIKQSSILQLNSAYFSEPQDIEFPTENGLKAHGLFYPPTNPDFTGPHDQRPPLLVKSHGGPTASASSALDLSIQFWTSRGIAVLDVNYGGSTGYGRAYRQRLNLNWGIVDVDDCVNGARYLVEQGLVDGNRLAIDGGSAGGYTTLCALTFRDTFKAGASYYGVSDIEALALDTHKFESRYLDNLVGPYPQEKELYHQRSAIHFTDRLNCPLILLQGLEDKVVPPDQAVRMFEAVKAKGLPVAYLPFEGEQHGFRRSENIKRALEAEYYFYSKVFGFELADQIEPLKIENL